MLKLAANEVIQPYRDLTLAPLTTRIVAEILAEVAVRRVLGVLQVSAAEQIGYEDLAFYLAEKYGRRNLVRPSTSREAGRNLEHVSKYVTLDTSRLVKELGTQPPQPWDMVREALDASLPRG